MPEEQSGNQGIPNLPPDATGSAASSRLGPNTPGKFTTELNVLKQPTSVPSLDLAERQPAKSSALKWIIVLGVVAVCAIGWWAISHSAGP